MLWSALWFKCEFFCPSLLYGPAYSPELQGSAGDEGGFPPAGVFSPSISSCHPALTLLPHTPSQAWTAEARVSLAPIRLLLLSLPSSGCVAVAKSPYPLILIVVTDRNEKPASRGQFQVKVC